MSRFQRLVHGGRACPGASRLASLGRSPLAITFRAVDAVDGNRVNGARREGCITIAPQVNDKKSARRQEPGSQQTLRLAPLGSRLAARKNKLSEPHSERPP